MSVSAVLAGSVLIGIAADDVKTGCLAGGVSLLFYAFGVILSLGGSDKAKTRSKWLYQDLNLDHALVRGETGYKPAVLPLHHRAFNRRQIHQGRFPKIVTEFFLGGKLQDLVVRKLLGHVCDTLAETTRIGYFDEPVSNENASSTL